MNSPENLLDKNGELLFSGFFDKKSFLYNRLDLKRIFCLKEWDRYIIYNKNYAVEISVSVSSYKLNIFICFSDFKSKKIVKRSFNRIITLDKFILPSSPDNGNIIFSDKKYSISLMRTTSFKIVKCNFVDFEENKNLFVNVWLNEENKSACSLIVPVVRSKSGFIYIRNINPIFANGVFKFGDIEVDLENKDSFVAINWGRGSFHYNVIKNIATYRASLSALINNVSFGFHVDYSANYSGEDGNIITFGDKTYGQKDICIHKNKTDSMKEWTLFSSDGKFELRFKPFFSCTDKRILGFHSFKRIKYFGYFSGQIILGKKPVFIKKLLGIIEEERF